MIQFDFHGTHSGPLPMPNGDLPPMGRTVEIRAPDRLDSR